MDNLKTIRHIFFGLMILIVAFYLIFFQLMMIWDYTVDDMYITLRYANNWVQGHGIVWNVNEPPVEGYTNFSFLLIGALALKLHLNPILVFKSIGAISLILTNIGLYNITRFWFSRYLSLVPSLWLLLYCGEIIWAVAGLETMFYQSLLVFAVLFLFKGLGYTLDNPQRSAIRQNYLIIASVILLLASITRPEAPLIAVIFFVITVYHLKKEEWTALIPAIGVYVAFYLPYFIWHWQYYHRLFPNSVYCKSIEPTKFAFLDMQYLQVAAPFLILSLLAFRQKDKRYYFLLIPSLVYLVLLISASDLMAYLNRLFLPAFALLLPLTLIGIRQLINSLIERYQLTTESFKVACYSFLIITLCAYLPKQSLLLYQLSAYIPQATSTIQHDLVNWLKVNVPANNHIVLGDCGLIPYFSSFSFIDSFCLNNLQMTTQYNNDRLDTHNCVRLLESQPKVVVLSSFSSHKQIYYLAADYCLKQHLAQYHYRFKKAFMTPYNDKNLYAYTEDQEDFATIFHKDLGYRYEVFIRQ